MKSVAGESNSKATDDQGATSVENAVDRASSRTPLNDDSGINPEKTRKDLTAKREGENRRAEDGKSADASSSSTNTRPGPAQTQPDRSGDKVEQPETPKQVKNEARELPEEDTKDAIRDWK